MKFAGLIAAAGDSVRMGQPKALLPFGDVTFVERLIETFSSAKIASIVVTVPEPPHQAAVEAVLTKYSIEMVPNHFGSLGLLGSIRSALSEIGDDIDGLIVCPVDAPFVSVALLDQMKSRFMPSTIVVPTHEGNRGHPILFSKYFFGDLMIAAEGGPDNLLTQYSHLVREVPWHDVKILQNINEPEDYRRAFTRNLLAK